MEKDIGKVKKNDSTDIVIRVDDFGGKLGVTIREYTSSNKYTGFTKSGTRIPAESFKEFKELINSIDESEFFSEKKEEGPEKKTKKKKEITGEVSEEDLL